MSIRDSQDIGLIVEKPATINIHDSQDITLVLNSVVPHIRDSQDITLVIFKRLAAVGATPQITIFT